MYDWTCPMVAWVFVCIVCAVVAAMLAQRRNLDELAAALAGLLFGPAAVALIALCVRTAEDEARRRVAIGRQMRSAHRAAELAERVRREQEAAELEREQKEVAAFERQRLRQEQRARVWEEHRRELWRQWRARMKGRVQALGWPVRAWRNWRTRRAEARAQAAARRAEQAALAAQYVDVACLGCNAVLNTPRGKAFKCPHCGHRGHAD
jgi:hypothetical protein